MFTIVKHPQLKDYRGSSSQPPPEIISHREGEPEPKKWSQKLKSEESTYKRLKQHQEALLESEIIYKRKIKDLEKEKAELLKIYEPTYTENKVLKSLLEHGPDAVKMKKLQKAKREMQGEVERLKDENKKLTESMNEVVKKHSGARDFVLEKNWHEILASSNKNRDKREVKPTQGPFPVKADVPLNKSRDLSETIGMLDEDTYDLELDTVEKEIKVILNNIKCLKQQKRKVDYAITMGKSAIVKNSPLENAIYEKLDEDLKAFKGNLKNAKKKHDELKQKLAEREKDEKARLSTEKDQHEIQGMQKEVTDIVQNKSYQSSETQTEVVAELNSENHDTLLSRVKTKKKRSSHENRAVQTDVVQDENASWSDKERIKYLDQYEKKKKKLLEEKHNEPKKISSKKIALEYARKLVIRKRDTYPDKEENLSEGLKRENDHVDSDKDCNKRSSNPVGSKRMSVHKTKNSVDYSNFLPNTNNSKEPVNYYNGKPEATCNIKPHKQKNKPVHSNYREMFERSNFYYKPRDLDTKTNLRRSRIKSRSLGDLDKQLKLDYRDKIMFPDIEIQQKEERKPLHKLRRSRLKSKSIQDLSSVENHANFVFNDDKATKSLPSKEMQPRRFHKEENQTWKSESDLHAVIENEQNENRYVKDFKFCLHGNDAFVHFRGEIQNDDEEIKRDETKYDEVLYDLKKQYVFNEHDVYQEFTSEVENFRHYKDSVREKQKLRHIESDFLPSLVPSAPLKFTSDGRHVTGNEIRYKLRKNKVNLT